MGEQFLGNLIRIESIGLPHFISVEGKFFQAREKRQKFLIYKLFEGIMFYQSK